jgi:acyl-CoA reductase-like NAD-dependent aldehyde dehydrogenase
MANCALLIHPPREETMRVDFIIDGEAVAATSGATFTREDPVTGAVASEAAAASEADVAKVVEAAHRAFPAWSESGPSQRRALLLKAADLLEARTADFSKAMTEEIGATGPWGGFNVFFAATLLREAAALTTQITGEIIPADKPGVLSMAVRQPAGVVLGLAPWNAPVILGVRAIAAPLACGNTVILRSSEVCPRTHSLIVEIMNEAGFPKGAVNLISNAPEDAPRVVAALIAHPAVKRVNFTGSSRVGREIAKLCAEHLKPVLLELGGKAPLLVLADADVDAAVDAAVFGAFANMGQVCMSTERLIVDETVADAFVEKLAKRAAALPAGDPRGHVVLGSLVNLAAAERMDALIADAKAKGAVVVAGASATAQSSRRRSSTASPPRCASIARNRSVR